ELVLFPNIILIGNTYIIAGRNIQTDISTFIRSSGIVFILKKQTFELTNYGNCMIGRTIIDHNELYFKLAVDPFLIKNRSDVLLNGLFNIESSEQHTYFFHSK